MIYIENDIYKMFDLLLRKDKYYLRIFSRIYYKYRYISIILIGLIRKKFVHVFNKFKVIRYSVLRARHLARLLPLYMLRQRYVGAAFVCLICSRVYTISTSTAYDCSDQN